MTTPIGKYKVKACGFDLGESAQKGTPFAAVSFPINGTLETWTGYLTEDACERTIQALRLMGWQGNDLETITLADLPGWVQADVREDRDRDKNVKLDEDGNPMTRIAFINSLSGMFGAPMGHEARKALSLRLRGKVAASPVIAPTLTVDEPAPKRTRDDPPPMPGDDAIPGTEDIPPF